MLCRGYAVMCTVIMCSNWAELSLMVVVHRDGSE